MPSTFIPTAEQIAARDATLSLECGEIVALNACAGSGKTTTMSFIAEAIQGAKRWRAIYICYNKEMADAARGRFPPNVDCRTVHSIAYAKVGYRFKGKLGNHRAREIMDLLGCPAADARAAVATINQFLCSQDGAITDDHVIAACGESDRSVLKLAGELWRRMCDVDDPAVKMTHDGYLKLWVMSSPDLGNLDLALIDESQDINPVILQLVMELVARGVRAVFVGDSHQSLYGFRLAVDAMAHVASVATHNLSLTESWRFPQHVADMANKVLRTLKGVDARLIGRGDGIARPDTPNRCTLARTNALLIQAAASCLSANHKIHFAATKAAERYDPFGPYRFQEILDVYSLYSGRGRPQMPDLARFHDYGEFRAFAKGTEGDGSDSDPELAPLADFVDKTSHEVPGLLRELSAMSVGPGETDYHFSTGHRAKGKEWNSVTILDDFLPLDDPAAMKKWKEKHTKREFIEAANLLYVVVTRGRCSFTPPGNCACFFAPPAGRRNEQTDRPLKFNLSNMLSEIQAKGRL
jgi:energy-coupling factor transporter ATP-binding protein EcfA2